MGRPISLRTRLTAVYLGCLVPLLAVIVWLAFTERHALEEEARQDVREDAASLAGELTRLVEGVEHLLHAVAASPMVQSADPGRCDRYLEQLQAASHGSAALGVTDAEGRVICLSRRVNTQQLDTSDRFYFKETMRTNALTTGEFAIGKAAGAKAVHFGYPLQDARGHPIGVAFAPLNLDWLARQLADHRRSRRGTVTIADRNGTVLVRLPETRLAGRALPPEWRGLMGTGATGTAELPDLADGTPQWVGYVPLGQGPNGLFVTVGVAAHDVMQPAQRALIGVLALGLAAALLAAGLAWWLVHRHVHRPLALLLSGSAALRRGELASRPVARVAADEEFTRLGEELDALRASLQAGTEERERAERELRAARDRAEATSRSLGALLAEAGHDLRQPIQSMVLNAELLGHKLRGRPEEPTVRRLQQSARHLVEMIDGLLSVSQLDAGRVLPELRPFAVAELMQGVTDEFAEQAVRRGIALHCSPTALWTVSDPALLRRIVGNCVSNALKYTSPGGRVELTCRPCGSREAELAIADTGIGIAAEHQAKVWDAFQQLQDPGRDLSKGLGLGLAIVRKIATLLGHAVELKSELGRGTTLVVRLPQADAVPRLPADAAQQGLRGRLLLVEDDEAVSRSVTELLRESGLEVIECRSAEQAMALMHEPERAPFDVVLADHHLPAQSGLEVLRAARRLWPRVRVVLMSGSLPPSRAEESAAEGIVVLAKPFGPAALIEVLGSRVARAR